MSTLNIAINGAGATKGAQQVNRALDSINNKANSTSTALAKPSKGLSMLGGAAIVGGITAVGAAVASLSKVIVQNADQLTEWTAQLTYITGSAEGAADAIDDIYKMSQRTGTAVKANTSAMVLLSQANEMTGNTSKDNVEMLEKLNMLMKTTGVSAQASGTALLQLSQALASGTLAGDEFKAINEAFPALMSEIAKSIGVPRGELKQYAADGKLTAEVVVKAIKGISVAHEDLPKTASAGLQKVSNAWNKLLSKIGMDNGVSGLLYDAFTKLSDWMDNAGSIFEPALNYLSATFDGFWSQVKGPLTELYSYLSGALANSIKWLQTDGAPLVTLFGQTVKLWFSYMGFLVGNVVKVMTLGLEGLGKIISWVVGLLNDFLATASGSKLLTIAKKLSSVFGGGGGSSDESDESTTAASAQSARGSIINNFNTQLSRNDITTITLNQQRQMARL